MWRRLPPRAVVGMGVLWVLLYAWPGQLDAQGLLRVQALGSDAYSLVWRAAELVLAGPPALLVVQVALIAYGIHAWLASSTSSAAWLTAGILAFPPVTATLAVVSPVMLGVALLATSLACTSPRRRLAVLALAVLIWPPSLVAAVLVQRTALAWIVLVALTLGTLLVGDSDATRARHDIAGTLAFTDDTSEPQLATLLAPTGLRAEVALRSYMSNAYVPGDPTTLVTGYRAPWLRAGDASALARARRELVREHAIAYAQHRVTATTAQLFGRRKHAAVAPRAFTSWQGQIAVAHGIPEHPATLQRALSRLFGVLAAFTPLFMPAAYLLLALVLAIRVRRERELVLLLASGIALQLSLVVTAVGDALVQSSWLVLVCALVVARRQP